MINSSKGKALYDASTASVIRTTAASAVTSDAINTGISLKELRTAYWHNYEVPHGLFEVVINVSALNSDASGTIFTVEIDDVSTMNNNPVKVGTLTVVATGCYRVVVDASIFDDVDTDHNGTDKFISVRHDVPGSGSPSVTYSAWLARARAA